VAHARRDAAIYQERATIAESTLASERSSMVALASKWRQRERTLQAEAAQVHTLGTQLQQMKQMIHQVRESRSGASTPRGGGGSNRPTLAAIAATDINITDTQSSTIRELMALTSPVRFIESPSPSFVCSF
jgi:hypothetical protein